MFSKTKEWIIELIFPTRCIGCSRFGEVICSSCLSRIHFRAEGNSSVPNVKRVLIALDLNQDIVKEAIYKFKYYFVKDLGALLSELLIQYLEGKKDEYLLLNFDVITPVPLSRKKKLYRGFNQSEVLSKAVSKHFNWFHSSELIHRRDTLKPQVDLSHDQRYENVRNIFSLKSPGVVKGKKILLIDDIVTTGATLSSCAKALKKSGAKEVWTLVLAKK